MNSILRFLSGDFRTEETVKEVNRSLGALDKKVDKAVASSVQHSQQVEGRVSSVLKKVDSLQKEIEALLKDAEQFRKTNKILEETIEAVREELRTAKDITIPGLVQANQLLLARWEAETQIQVARAVLVRTKEE